MPRPQSITDARSAAAMHDDLLQIVGDIDERMALDILALCPTVAEIEEAAMWVSGQGDVLAKTGHPLAGIPAEIFEILTADEEEEEPTRG